MTETLALRAIQKYYNRYILRGNCVTTAKDRSAVILRVLKNLNEITRPEVERYLLKLREKGCTPNSYNTLISRLRPFFKFCLEEGFADDASLLEIDQIKGTPPARSTFSDNEIQSFLTLPYVGRSKCYQEAYERFTVYFSIMAFSAMRCSEAAGLTVDDIDFGQNLFVLWQTKNNESRMVPIAPNIQPLVREYITTVPGKYLFPNRFDTGPIGKTAWTKQFQSRMRRLGIKRRGLTPYSFRASLATALAANGCNVFTLQKLLGQKSILSTMRYVKMSTKDVEKMLSTHPAILKLENPELIIQSRAETVKSWQTDRDSRFVYEIKETQASLDFHMEIKRPTP